MPRIPKQPKPKTVAYERIDRSDDPDECYPLLDWLIANRRPDLAEANFSLAWRLGWKPNKDGQLVLGKCKNGSDLDREFAGFDFVIVLNAEAWKKLTPIQRRALMHHELMHAAVSEGEDGEPKRDARERIVYRVRKHDFEDFFDIIKEYGMWKEDLKHLGEVITPPPSLFDDASEVKDVA